MAVNKRFLLDALLREKGRVADEKIKEAEKRGRERALTQNEILGEEVESGIKPYITKKGIQVTQADINFGTRYGISAEDAADIRIKKAKRKAQRKQRQ